MGDGLWNYTRIIVYTPLVQQRHVILKKSLNTSNVPATNIRYWNGMTTLSNSVFYTLYSQADVWNPEEK